MGLDIFGLDTLGLDILGLDILGTPHVLYRTRRMIHDVVMAVVLKICSIFIFIFKIIIYIHFKENGVYTLYLGQAW